MPPELADGVSFYCDFYLCSGRRAYLGAHVSHISVAAHLMALLNGVHDLSLRGKATEAIWTNLSMTIKAGNSDRSFGNRLTICMRRASVVASVRG